MIRYQIGDKLPSFHEGFGNIALPSIPTPLITRCPKCEIRGEHVPLSQDTPCPRWHAKEQPSPPFSQPQLLRHGGTTPQIDTNQLQPHAETRLLTPWLSLSQPSPSRTYSENSSESSPVLAIHQNSMNSTPFCSPANLSGQHKEPQPSGQQYVHGNPFPLQLPPAFAEEDKKISRIQKNNTDNRAAHRDAEKNRRDFQNVYSDLTRELQQLFPIAILDACTCRCTCKASASLFSSLLSSKPRSHTPPPDIHSPGHRKGRKEKPTKKDNFYDELFWVFHICLRVDHARVKEWLNGVKVKGESLMEQKMEELKKGTKRGKPGKREDKVRCLKGEAALEVWGVMERDFEELCLGREGYGRVEIGEGKRRRPSSLCGGGSGSNSEEEDGWEMDM